MLTLDVKEVKIWRIIKFFTCFYRIVLDARYCKNLLQDGHFLSKENLEKKIALSYCLISS
jgi:hypothetical protein